MSASSSVLVNAYGPFKPQSITVISGTRLLAKLPAVLGPAAYNVCVYDNTASTPSVIATGKVTLYDKPAVSGVAPSSGPSAGGTAITITGTGFTSKTTATIDGLPLTVKVTTGLSTELTATVPAHKVGSTNIVVSTEGGTSNSDKTFTFKDGITVQPQTIVGDADSGKSQILDISGAGFSDFDFGSGATKSHVYLVQGNGYVHKDTVGSVTANDKAECDGVLLISDLELICTLDPASAVNTAAAKPKNGSYQVIIVANAKDLHPDAQTTNTAGRETIITSGSALTIAPY
jgi:hypothetical protein